MATKPFQGRITQQFGNDLVINGVHVYAPYRPPYHEGTDYAAADDSPVLAALTGRVDLVSTNFGGKGYYIRIDHGGGVKTGYGHLSAFRVKAGDNVSEGQQIAISGGVPRTPGAGTSTGAHGHFDLIINGAYVDPQQLFKGGGNMASDADIITLRNLLDKRSEQLNATQAERDQFQKQLTQTQVQVEQLRDELKKAVGGKITADLVKQYINDNLK